MIALNVNGKAHSLDVEDDMPLLWVLREIIGLTGTKYGCGIAQCGACTVYMDGVPVRSCAIPASAMQKAKITTIEGLSADVSHPVQKAWLELDVPQCGYCQSGQIMAAAALLKEKPAPMDKDIDEAMTNICRCGTYQRVVQRFILRQRCVLLRPETGRRLTSIATRRWFTYRRLWLQDKRGKS